METPGLALMRDRSTPRHRPANQSAPINLICPPQSMSTKKPMATHSGGSVRLAPGQGLITQRGAKRAVFGMPGWPCAGVDAGFAAAGPGRRAEVTGEPPGRRLGLQVARHPGDKDARGQAHGERQDAVSQAGNDQGLAPLQAIAPGLGRRGRRRSRPAGTAACPPCRPAPRGRCPWHPGPGRTPALPSRGPPRPGPR